MESDPDCSVEGHKMSADAALESSDDQGPQRKRSRVVWNSELQARFVKSFEELGPGAMPKSILEVGFCTTQIKLQCVAFCTVYCIPTLSWCLAIIHTVGKCSRINFLIESDIEELRFINEV